MYTVSYTVGKEEASCIALWRFCLAKKLPKKYKCKVLASLKVHSHLVLGRDSSFESTNTMLVILGLNLFVMKILY
jgi:hypothetical protein